MNSKFGIDFIGLPRGKLGIGEQIRSLLRIALHCDFNINVIDCSHPLDNFVNDHDEFNDYISNDFKYPLRIYSLTQSHIVTLIYRYGVQYFDNKMNIFHLAWEFDQRPKQFDDALLFSDEIWGISTFTSKSFYNDFGIPVNTMPISIDMPKFKKISRSFFGLPENKFLFCFSFDINSWISRKNPLACIDAFKMAFPNNPFVGLVIKISNANYDSLQWSILIESIKNDDRFYVINEVLDRSSVFSLFDSCDVYVSLHRSEGFGMGIAENMVLGNPIICTGFSGNMDFCSVYNSNLVDYSIVDVSDGDYLHANGFKWAEPSVASAARNMKNVYENQDQAFIKSEIAKKNILDNFSSLTLSKHFRSLVNNFYVNNIFIDN